MIRETFDPASDLSFDDYRHAMLKKSLPQLIKETSTNLEFYTLDTFTKKFENWPRCGWEFGVSSPNHAKEMIQFLRLHLSKIF